MKKNSKVNLIKYIIAGILLWIIVDFSTAGGFRMSYFEKYGPTLLVFYLGYPIVFAFLIFKLKFTEFQLLLATLVAIFIVEVVFTRNPLLMTFPAFIIGIPLAVLVYAPLTYFPLWWIRGGLLKHKKAIIFLSIVELCVICLTAFGGLQV